ncbi:cytidylyltransferase domain-containing protein [Planctomycetota bacterium]
MIPALLIGRKGSVGFPGKNTTRLLGRKLAEYPIIHAKEAKCVDRIYMSTDDPDLMDIAKQYDVEVIERPDYLSTNEALGEDAFKHGFDVIKERNSGTDIELVTLLFCNAVTFLNCHIESAVEAMRNDPELDSAVTVSQYNWYSPVRARRIGNDGLLHPFIPFESYPEMQISCDRDSQGDVYFADVCVSVVRPRCLEDLSYGVLPQRWMGRKICPIQNWGGARH